MLTRAIEQINRGHILFVLLLMAQFQFWDGVITHVFVTNGLVKEANPLVAPLVSGGSFLLIKLLGIAAILLLLWIISKRFPRMAVVAASCISMFYVAVITWNFMVFFQPFDINFYPFVFFNNQVITGTRSAVLYPNSNSFLSMTSTSKSTTLASYIFSRPVCNSSIISSFFRAGRYGR